MRNLKRVLALALALVMILGMMVIGSSAASYSDSAAIDEDYVEAVEILTGMGVFEGTDKGFEPKTVLNRASAAALIYRVLTGDVAKKQIGLYDFSTFADVVEGEWYTPYITYAANGGYLKGYNGNAMPYETVTGIQVLAIMLRAAGYGQNGEFEGAGWKDGILTTAKELGVTDGIATNDLDKGASRELVAQLIFNAMTKAKMVSYAPLLGYYQAKDAQTLAEKVFGLTSAEIADDWGRPAVAWYNAKKGLAKGIYAIFAEDPIATYTTAVSQCDIAKDQGAKKDYKTDFYFNGKYVADKAVAVTNTKPTVGAQGTQVEVYADRVVVVDTYLAQVTWLNYEKADKNGHIYQEASMEIKVELGKDCADLAAKYVVPGNDYARYTYVLVNINEAGKYAEIIGEAETFEGAQSKIWSNGARHTIDKVDYTDAVHFHMDAAGASDAKFTWFLDQFGNLIGSKEIAAKYGYAVLKDMNWVKGEGAQATLVYMDGTEETVTVNTIDGEWVDGWAIDNALTKLDDQALIDNSWGGVSTEPRYNSEYNGAALYKITYNKNGSVNLHGIVGNDEVVSYSNYAVIDTSSSVILDGADFGKLYVTTDTEILVREGNARTGYTYETYTIDTLPEFAQDAAEIFYTVKKVYGTTYAVDRLYIKTAALEADFGTHLFTTTNEFYRVAGTNDWHMTVLVDGVEREIVTYEGLAKYLAANTGKLFHVEWNTYDPYAFYYGYIDDVRLINEVEDDDENFYGCNYLSGSTVLTSSSLINEGASYRFDANTVVYGAIDSIDELGTSNVNYDGIWVLADPTTSYSRAAVIYVGTKLNTSASADVFYGENYAFEATPDKDYANWTINVASDVESVEVALVPLYTGSVVVDAEGNYDYYWEGTVEAGETVELTVWNEEGTKSKDFTITVKAAEVKVTSEITIENVTMDAGAGCTVVFTATRTDGKTIFAERFAVELYNANGNKVYTENVDVTITGENEYTAEIAYELTQGAEYYVVVTASGLNNCEGSTATSDLYEATVTANP